MSQSIFPGPIASQNNPEIEPQWFQPSNFPITAITKGKTTTVTLGTAIGDVSNNMVVGQLVRFQIPFPYGIRQLNNQQGYVISVPSANQVTVNIDTSIGYDSFISSPPYSTTGPSLAAIGDTNTGGTNATGRSNNPTTVTGAFENISPAAGG